MKVYASERASVVAGRIAALAAGPVEPVVPRLLHVDPQLRLVVLSDVPGRALRHALLERDMATCRRAGAILAVWHAWWDGRAPAAMREHTIDRELDILRARAERASPQVARAVQDALADLAGAWQCRTVVHRDLYEEQVIVAERVGLIDVDDAALGPPELDLGNLVAHVELLERRSGQDLAREKQALLGGYGGAWPAIDGALLDRCRRLTLLRLACLNDDRGLAEQALRAEAIP